MGLESDLMGGLFVGNDKGGGEGQGREWDEGIRKPHPVDEYLVPTEVVDTA